MYIKEVCMLCVKSKLTLLWLMKRNKLGLILLLLIILLLTEPFYLKV